MSDRRSSSHGQPHSESLTSFAAPDELDGAAAPAPINAGSPERAATSLCCSRAEATRMSIEPGAMTASPRTSAWGVKGAKRGAPCWTNDVDTSGAATPSKAQTAPSTTGGPVWLVLRRVLALPRCRRS